MSNFPIGTRVQFITTTISFDVTGRTFSDLRTRDTVFDMKVMTKRDSSGMYGLGECRPGTPTIEWFARADEMRKLR